eukprot:14982375-Heterocapsa_arctica.AAC.1
MESPHLKKFIQILQAAGDDYYIGDLPGYNLCVDAYMVKLIQDIHASLDIDFKKDKAGDDARWKERVQEATRGGAGRAHK